MTHRDRHGRSTSVGMPSDTMRALSRVRVEGEPRGRGHPTAHAAPPDVPVFARCL